MCYFIIHVCLFFLEYKSHEVWVPCFFFFSSFCLKCWVQSIVKLRFRQIINECMGDWMNEEQPVQTMFIICYIQGSSVLFYPQTRAITASSSDGEKYEEGKMRLSCFIKQKPSECKVYYFKRFLLSVTAFSTLLKMENK